jgi:hypothetical protein
MNKNFVVGQSNELIKENRLYDLHNLYDYVGIVLSGASCLFVFFEPNVQYKEDQVPIMLEFNEVEYLEFSPNFGMRRISYLEEMGYKSFGDQDDAWLLSQQQATDNDHLFFRLEGNDFIRVSSKNAYLHEGVVLPIPVTGC